jgi:UDP-2,3-diacylglucosamine pyrophosphatase LpxH
MSKSMGKTEAVLDLKLNWDILHPKVKRDRIYTLLGHRTKFITIAQLIGRSLEEVKAVYKGQVEAPVGTKPLSNLSEDCGYSDFYQGTVPPTCAGGLGCKKCWNIYQTVNNLDHSQIDPKVEEVAPIKSLYVLDFDEILEKYRQWIGMSVKGIPASPRAGNSDYLEGLIISDIHAPFHDEQRFAQMIADTKGTIDVCILAGDAGDFHNYSKYMKYGQHFSIRDEHKSLMAVLSILSESYPEIVVMPGNHDERTRKKYAQLLPADLYQALLDFHGNNAFDFSEIMTEQFENIIIPTVPKDGFAEYRFVYQINDIIVGHPELFSKIANKSVAGFIDWLKKKAEPMGLVKPFNAVVMGHTHMAGKTWNDYKIVGIENGCICMTPDYDAGAKLNGSSRPLTRGYTRFRTNKLTGITKPNDINFVELY